MRIDLPDDRNETNRHEQASAAGLRASVDEPTASLEQKHDQTLGEQRGVHLVGLT